MESKKDYLVTLLLSFFLGGLGIHRFYTGHIVIGIVQLLTCGGCCIWSLIDFICLCFGKFVDSEGNQLADYNPKVGKTFFFVFLGLIIICFLFCFLGGILAVAGAA